jgi:hypothetical protein
MQRLVLWLLAQGCPVQWARVARQAVCRVVLLMVTGLSLDVYHDNQVTCTLTSAPSLCSCNASEQEAWICFHLDLLNA